MVKPLALSLSVVSAFVICGVVSADDSPTASEVQSCLKKAAAFYYKEVGINGGYVYHVDLSTGQRWGEGPASDTQIWVQPPGTPTVGEAFLAAYEATGDEAYLAAATKAAHALLYGQLKSGGWTNSIDFDPKSKSAGLYRNGRGKGKNNSTLDDDITPAALRFLMKADRALKFKDPKIHSGVIDGLRAMLAAQFTCGAFPQVWTEPVSKQPTIKANYPSYDWRTEGRIKNYWDMYTLNDNVAGNVAQTLLLASVVYDDPVYLTALRSLGDFLILAQMPAPQPAWAQQYNYSMQPIWARRFEPAAIASSESQDVMKALLLIHSATGDAKYLKPIAPAIRYLRDSKLEDGQLARYYELKSNRPLYMNRRGKEYSLTYDDSNLPDHYGWKRKSELDDIERRYLAAKEGDTPTTKTKKSLAQQSRTIIDSLDEQGRWVTQFEGDRLVGQPKIGVGASYLSSEVFAKNVRVLSDYLNTLKSQR